MHIKVDEWNIMCDRIQTNLISIMTWADENYSNNVFILFDILGILWNKNDRLIENKIYNINECLSFIINMFNHASNTF